MASPNDDRELIELFLSCRQLNMSQSKFQKEHILILKRQIGPNNWSPVGQTEVFKNQSNIDFAQSFELEFIFETRQRFKVELINVENRHSTQGIVLGEAQFDIAEIMGSLNNLKILDIIDPLGANNGKLVTRIDKTDKNRDSMISFKLDVRNVPKFSMFSSKNSFVKIYKIRSKGGAQAPPGLDSPALQQQDWLLVHTTPQATGSEVSFGVLAIKASKLCSGQPEMPLKVELWKYKQDGQHYPMGQTFLTVSQLLSGSASFPFNLQKDKHAGTSLVISNVRQEEFFNFTDFLRGNLSINLVVGIDFTASNGKITDPGSLHFIQPQSINLYQKAILSVGEILEHYNHTQNIPAYGFGAKIGDPPAISHFFPINLNYQNPFFQNFGELFAAYELILQKIHFSGPTNFATVIQRAIEFTYGRFQMDPFSYTVLLILTDGIINDMAETVDQIVAASFLPMSIIIVGIGSDDFANMKVLDADIAPLVDSRGQKMNRDVVQFVPFREFANNPFILREQVLAELPAQVVAFYAKKGIKPRPPATLDPKNYATPSTINFTEQNGQKNDKGFYPSLESIMKK